MFEFSYYIGKVTSKVFYKQVFLTLINWNSGNRGKTHYYANFDGEVDTANEYKTVFCSSIRGNFYDIFFSYICTEYKNYALNQDFLDPLLNLIVYRIVKT